MRWRIKKGPVRHFGSFIRHGGACLNPRTRGGRRVKGSLYYIASWRPAWATRDHVSTTATITTMVGIMFSSPVYSRSRMMRRSVGLFKTNQQAKGVSASHLNQVGGVSAKGTALLFWKKPRALVFLSGPRTSHLDGWKCVRNARFQTPTHETRVCMWTSI